MSALALLISAGVACSDDSPEEGPNLGESDTCRDPAPEVTLDSLTVGLVEDGVFMPLTADQVVPLIYGDQGLPMVGIYLQVTGGSVPDCLDQDTRALNSSGNSAGDLIAPLTMHRQERGTYRTNLAWVILSPAVQAGDALTIRPQAGQTVFECRVYLDFMGAARAVPRRSAASTGQASFRILGPGDRPASSDRLTVTATDAHD